MTKPENFETWVIRHKTTGEYFKALSGKNSWKRSAHAKNAWSYNFSGEYSTYNKEFVEKECLQRGVYIKSELKKRHGKLRQIKSAPYFDEQDTWELVNISQTVESKGSDLKRAEDLLKQFLDIYPEVDAVLGEELLFNFNFEIENYFKEVK